MKRKKIIKLPSLEAVKAIATANGCSIQYAYSVLRYESDSEKAQKMRKEAVEIYGGVETTKIVF